MRKDSREMRSMTSTPTFLGLGGARCGSTWLHTLLSKHPDVLMPKKRKEIDFFNKNWERSFEWYLNCFKYDTASGVPIAIGDVSPGYSLNEKCAYRVAQCKTVSKFIYIVRNPVNRLVSHYHHHLQVTNEKKSIDDFVKYNRFIAIDNGLYAQNLKRYLQYFSLNQLLILVFEEAFRDIVTTTHRIAHFLEIDPAKFYQIPGKIGEAGIPRHGKALAWFHKRAHFLRKYDLDWLISLGHRIKLREFFTGTSSKISITQEQRNNIFLEYVDDIREFETLTGFDLSNWKQEFER